MPIFVIDQEKNQRCRQRFVNKFLLKRKFAIDVYIKIVAQITTILMSGQPFPGDFPRPRQLKNNFWSRKHIVVPLSVGLAPTSESFFQKFFLEDDSQLQGFHSHPNLQDIVRVLISLWLQEKQRKHYLLQFFTHK